jgi:predicted GIY-YIG superfamily endonuclease
MNGIHEVTGSIPVWSTSLRSASQGKAVAPKPRSGEGGLTCSFGRPSVRSASSFRSRRKSFLPIRCNPLAETAISQRWWHTFPPDSKNRRRYFRCYSSRMTQHRKVVYVLKNAEADPRFFYIGLTSDAHARLLDHNAGRCRHTARYRPWQLHVRSNSRTSSALSTSNVIEVRVGPRLRKAALWMSACPAVAQLPLRPRPPVSHRTNRVAGS